MSQSPSKSKRLLIATTVVSAILIAAASGAAIVLRQRAADNVTNLFGGPAGLQTVMAPTMVEAYRVNRLTDGEDPDSQATVGGAKITAGPVAVDAESARELADVLKNPRTYGWDFAKGCKFDPGVALRFASATSTVDVILCFHCEELQIYLDDKKVGGEDFDAAAARLAVIMKRLFPDDEEIQKL